MKELKVGERVTLEVIEQNVCNGAMIDSLDMMIYTITRTIMVGVMDSSVNQKNVQMVKM